MPDDPVWRGMNNDDMMNQSHYEERWKAFNLNYPNFYCSFTAQHQPDTLYKIPQKYKKVLLSELLEKTANWEATQTYFQAIESMDKTIQSTQRDTTNADALIDLKKSIFALYRTSKKDEINSEIDEINNIVTETTTLNPLITTAKNLKKEYQNYLNNSTNWKKYIPSFRWNGIQNQYHIWIFGNHPWIEKSEVIVDIVNKELKTTVSNHSFTASSTGYYRVNLRTNLESNEGSVKTKSLKTKKVFDIGVNRNPTKYTIEELAKAKFIVPAEKGEIIPIVLNATNYTTINKLKYTYDLEIERLLNYNPAKQSKGFIRFDFGKNYQLQSVAEVIKGGVFWTVVLSLLSIVLTYIIAIPIGVYSSRRKGTKIDNIISTFLFMLYSLPNFWVATLLIVFICAGLGWFPVFGLGDIPEGATMFQTFQIRAYHLIIPLFCWTYPSLAFLSRQMRGGMLATLSQDFIRTARAKGLEEKTVIWKHGFRNSLLPIITLFANVFPRMVSGSIVIEVIFGIPGMGKIILDAISSNDFPTVFTIAMLTALLTMIGYLIADILYALVDPRIKYK
ncbi:MAG: ABC transporter permease [Saprospiraceae bacterium]